MKPHDSQPCLATDHYYWNFSVVWCPHRQAFLVSKTRYLETGHYDDFQDYERQVVELGPFDAPYEVLALIVGWLNDYRPEWSSLSGPASAPGSPG